MIFAYSLVIGCSLLHIFCCGIPLVTTLVGFSTTIGLFSQANLQNSLFENFERFEIEILFLSGVILLISFLLKLRAKKMPCCNEEGKKFCGISEKANSLFLKISTILYAVSLTTFAAS